MPWVQVCWHLCPASSWRLCNQKKDSLLIESLGFIHHISSAGHFSSTRLTTKFLIFVAWRIAAPRIILGSLETMSKHLAISSSVLLHLSANPFCFGVSGMVFSCRMPASKQYVLNCSVRNSFALSCLSFLGVPTLRTNFFRLASASLFALSKSTNTNIVYWSANTMQNRNPESDSTLKGPITSVNTLSSFSSAWVSATLGTGVFVILANAHKLHTHWIHRAPPLSPVHSWSHPLDSNGPIVCATSLQCQVSRRWNSSWILERCRVSKTNYFVVLVLPEFSSGISCSCFFSQTWSYVPTPCILRPIEGLKNSPAHTKHFWVRNGIPFVWGYADPHTASSHHSGSLYVGISDHWLTGQKVQESINVRHYVTMWSVQPLSTSMPAVFHWIRAAQYSSSGEANVGPIATDSCLPPSLCLLHALSRWPYSPHLLYCAVSFLLQSLATCPGRAHKKQFPFLGPFLKSRFTTSATEPLCPLCLCAVLSWKFCSLFLTSVKFVAGLKLSCITNFHTSFADHWGPSQWRGSLRLLPLPPVALWANPVLWWRSYPNPQHPRAAVEQAEPPKSPLSAYPHSKISFAKALKPLLHLRCRHRPNSYVSSAWGLLHLESVPDATTYCSVSPICLQLLSHMYSSAPCGSFFHYCSPHWLVVQARWVAPLSQVVIYRVPSSASLPQILYSRLESPVFFLCRSAASLSVDPSLFEQAKQLWKEKVLNRKGLWQSTTN